MVNVESIDCCYRSRYIVLWAGYLKVIPHVAKIFKFSCLLPMIVIVLDSETTHLAFVIKHRHVYKIQELKKLFFVFRRL